MGPVEYVQSLLAAGDFEMNLGYGSRWKKGLGKMEQKSGFMEDGKR